MLTVSVPIRQSSRIPSAPMSRHESSSEGLPDRLRSAGELFHRFGAAAWPGAAHLLLLEVDQFGSLTGSAQLVCRACARDAACRVLERLDELVATDSWRQDLPYLELAGESGPAEGPCSICGDCP